MKAYGCRPILYIFRKKTIRIKSFRITKKNFWIIRCVAAGGYLSFLIDLQRSKYFSLYWDPDYCVHHKRLKSRYKQIDSIVVILDVMDSYMDPITDEFFTFSLTFEWINSICKWIHRTEKKNILICIFPYYCSIINFLCILVGQIQLMLQQQQHSWLNIVIYSYIVLLLFSIIIPI